MIYLGDSKEVKLERADVETVEQRLDELRYICEQNIEGNPLTDTKNKIGAIEFTIQSNRVAPEPESQ